MAIIGFIVDYWIEFFFGLIISIICYLYKRISDYTKLINSTKNGVKVLLKGEIIRRYNEYTKKGSMSIFEKEIVMDLYQEYKNLGGNGMISNLVEDIEDIPLSRTFGGD